MEAIESSTRSRLPVRLTLPPASFFKFPPADLPLALPPPPDHPALAHPFTIRADWYNGLLSANVPITIALVYASVVTFLNSVNVRRKYKPWPFSQTKLFRVLIVVHNIFLALYSLWTFIGMYNALRLSFVSPRNEYGWAATADSLCKIHGPRGIGSSANFNETTTAWTITNRAFHLGADGLTPDSTDAGRIWNEGLAFYGWLFYISKFYEVIDTLIILAKGKKSSLLQTYHHAGAMLGMWAGIRYMSPPIWMFVMVNSFIHSIMYTFYLCSAINIKVPVWFKRTLTTMQITQFVVGASYAFAHLFVKYQSPFTMPYLYDMGNVVSSLPSDASSVASVAVATASAETASWLKKLALRAAGREGLAENVLNERGEPFGIDAIHAVRVLAKREEMRFRNDVQWVNCLDTSGQTFAILLNCIYLAPLTWLFARFFIKSYLQAVERRRRSSVSERAYIAGQSGKDAFKRVGRRVSEALEDSQDGVEDLENDLVIVDGDQVRKEMAAAVEKAKAEVKEKVGSLKQAGADADAHNKKDDAREAEDEQQERDEAADTLNELAQRVKPDTTQKEAKESEATETANAHEEATQKSATSEADDAQSEHPIADQHDASDETTQTKQEHTKDTDAAKNTNKASEDDSREAQEEDVKETKDTQSSEGANENNELEAKEQEKAEESAQVDSPEPSEQPVSYADAVKEPVPVPEAETEHATENNDRTSPDDQKEDSEKQSKENAVHGSSDKDGEVATEAEQPKLNGDQHERSNTEPSAGATPNEGAAQSDEVVDAGRKDSAKSASKDEESQNKADEPITPSSETMTDSPHRQHWHSRRRGRPRDSSGSLQQQGEEEEPEENGEDEAEEEEEEELASSREIPFTLNFFPNVERSSRQSSRQ